MNFFLVSVKRVTATTSELFNVTIAANGESGGGSVDVSVVVTLTGAETMDLTLAQIESSAIEKAKIVLAKEE